MMRIITRLFIIFIIGAVLAGIIVFLSKEGENGDPNVAFFQTNPQASS